MSDDSSKHSAPSDPDALRAEIDVVRAELGDTVDALAAKADVKGQVAAKKAQVTSDLKVKTAELKDKTVELKDDLKVKTADSTAQVRLQAARGQEKLAPYQPWPRVAAGALAALVVALIATRAVRRRRARG